MRPSDYMDLSVWIRWSIVGVVDVWLLMAPFLWINISCEDDESFRPCFREKLATPMMIVLAITGLFCLVQMVILLVWIYDQRLKIWNWVKLNWNQCRNNVVDLEAEQPQPVGLILFTPLLTSTQVPWTPRPPIFKTF